MEKTTKSKLKDNPNSFRSISLKSLKKNPPSPVAPPRMIVRKKNITAERSTSEGERSVLSSSSFLSHSEPQDDSVQAKVLMARQNFQTIKTEIQNIIQEHPDNNNEFYSVLASLQGIFKLIEVEMITKIGENPSAMTQEKLDAAIPNLRIYSKVFKTIDKVIFNLIKDPSDFLPAEEEEEEEIGEVRDSLSGQQRQLLNLLTEEESYIGKLDVIVNKYLPAFQREQLLNKLDQHVLFSSAPALLKLHLSLYKHMQSTAEDSSLGFGDHLLSTIADFKLYQQYSINFTDATQCYERLMKDKAFAAIVKQLDAKESKEGRDGLSHLLQRPLSRIDELIFQLEEYMKELPPASKERAKLSEARDQLQDLMESIEQRESVADNLAKVMEVGLGIENLNENLVRPDRRYIYEGPLKLTPQGQKKAICDYAFLFNDVIIYCNSGGGGKSYSYVGQIYMHTAAFKDLSDDQHPLHFLLTAGKDSYRAGCVHQKEKQNWLLNMGKVIREVERTRKVFGVPLKVLMKREKEYDIPVIVEKSIHFIYLYGLDKEGLFRQTGRSTQIEKLKSQLNQGTKVFFSENMDVHSVAALFKQWLRELPEPLLTWEAFPLFVAASQAPSPSDQILLIKEIIEKLPKENRFVCQHMMKCLRAVCDNEPKTKMNPSNLAVVFAPNIIKNSDQLDFNQSHFECVNDSFKIMLENYEEIFKGVEEERTTVIELRKAKAKANKGKKKLQRNSRSWSGSITNNDMNVKEGPLLVNSDGKKWIARHVILKPQSLLVQRDPKSKKVKSTYSLEGANVSSAVPNAGKNFSFSLETAKECVYFAAMNGNEQEEWVSAIRECFQIMHLHKMNVMCSDPVPLQL